ncbi:MAG: hypothetical protein KDE14_07405 [Rhodobacteraceae bacterium]|nr:hypothetical protein [Paracoccaceae bacterium]
MLTTEQKELLNFLTESAKEAVANARRLGGAAAHAYLQEAEELMTIRASMLGRFWADQDDSNQLEFDLKIAA